MIPMFFHQWNGKHHFIAGMLSLMLNRIGLLTVDHFLFSMCLAVLMYVQCHIATHFHVVNVGNKQFGTEWHLGVFPVA